MHHIFLLFSKEGTTTVCYVRHIDNFRIHSTLYKLHILYISFFQSCKQVHQLLMQIFNIMPDQTQAEICTERQSC